MGDDAQLVEDAISSLNEIAQEFRGERLGQLAAQFSHLIAPRMAFDAKPDFQNLRERHEQVPKDFADEALRLVTKKYPNYKTPVFKCLEDFEKCKRSRTTRFLCHALLAVCVGKHVIPLVRHK
jgi:hypothetical protein